MEGQCKKSYWVFFEGTGVTLNNGLAFKNALSLQCSIYGVGSVIWGFCVYWLSEVFMCLLLGMYKTTYFYVN